MKMGRAFNQQEGERSQRREDDSDGEQECLQRAGASRGLDTDDRREPARLWQELSRPLGELRADEGQLR